MARRYVDDAVLRCVVSCLTSVRHIEVCRMTPGLPTDPYLQCQCVRPALLSGAGCYRVAASGRLAPAIAASAAAGSCSTACPRL